MNDRGTVGKMSQDDYLARLEGAMHDDQDDQDENPGKESEEFRVKD